MLLRDIYSPDVDDLKKQFWEERADDAREELKELEDTGAIDKKELKGKQRVERMEERGRNKWARKILAACNARKIRKLRSEHADKVEEATADLEYFEALAKISGDKAEEDRGTS